MDFSHRSVQSVLGSLVERGNAVTSLPKDGMNDFIKSIILKNPMKEAFYVLDLGVVVSLMQQWTHNLPDVHPFYAVKCNPDPSLLGLLAGLGTSFDCASRAEIESVLALGVSPDKIIFANPCKQESHIKYAACVGVNLATFDSSYEIEKIRQHHPICNLLIRVKPPRSGGRRDLGKKYGALPNEVEPLLQAAKTAGLSVLGASFHIGSGDADPQAYISAIAEARAIFGAMTRLGMSPMTLLDIGGGFSIGSRFESAANVIKSTLKAYFQDQTSLTVISEPGRFIAETAFTLVANIIGKRVRGDVREYWINDGAHGSMNHVYKDTTPVVMVTPFALISNPSNPTCRGETTYSSTVFGPTCDGDDIVMMGEQLPELHVNDWLVFPNMGAYTSAVGTNFNGFNTSFIQTHLAYLSSN